MEIELKAIDSRYGNQWDLPKRATPGSAGFDLRAAISRNATVNPFQTVKIPTGLCVHIKDPGVAMLVVPRSGFGGRGLVLGNLVGTIDSDYQGEIMLSAWNRTSDTQFEIIPGERIAQAIFIPVLHPNFRVVEEFTDASLRGERGHGHTGSL